MDFIREVRKVIPDLGMLPKVEGIEIYGAKIPLQNEGGDHITWVDFKSRYNMSAMIEEALGRGRRDIARKLEENQHKAGMLLSDVAGHEDHNSILTAAFHHAFLLGVLDHLYYTGEVPVRLFEHLNTRFYNARDFTQNISMIYGEISEQGKFRYISAGSPPPVIYSNLYDRIFHLEKDQHSTTFPIGLAPSGVPGTNETLDDQPIAVKPPYEVNEISLMGKGDILILYTDGLSDHENEDNENYFPDRLESIIRKTKNLTLEKMFDAIREDILSFAAPKDDISYILIRNN